MIRDILLVGIGSAIGGIGRFLLGKMIYTAWTRQFPLPTLVINILGCFLIGLLMGFSEKNGLLTAPQRLLLATGLCGGFTTFSAFAWETIVLMRSGAYSMILSYLTASVCLGILAAWFGLSLTR